MNNKYSINRCNITYYIISFCLSLLILTSCITHAQEIKPLKEKLKDTKENRWESYFKRKLLDPPAGFVVEGLKSIPKPSPDQIAIDLGSGVGHETMVLLKKGYNVIAIDNEQIAFKYMMLQPNIQQYRQHLKTIVSDFEHLNFANIPDADLIVASFSLPFVSAKDFDRIWQSVTAKIKPGGYIIINLFDASFTFFEQRFRSHMTFHTKAQARHLFNQFHITHFREVNVDSLKPGTQNHYYVIIARKTPQTVWQR